MDVHSVISECVNFVSLSASPDTIIDAELGAEHPEVMAKKSVLKGVLLNLGLNGAEAAGDGGRVEFRTSNIFIDEKVLRGFPVFP